MTEAFPPERSAMRAAVREKLDTAVQALNEQRAIADAVGTGNLALAQRIALLGFSGESAAVFDLLPLVHVAWADGKIQKNERAAIFEILQCRGLTPDHEGWQLLEALLEKKPSDLYVDSSLQVLAEVLGSTKPVTATTVVRLCERIADAAGGMLGFGRRISPEEREIIERVAKTLGVPPTA